MGAADVQREREKSLWSAVREGLIIQNEQDCHDHKNRFSSHLIDLSEKRREEKRRDGQDRRVSVVLNQLEMRKKFRR